MATTRVAIIDSGGANIASLQFALDRLGIASTLAATKNEICSATHVILPGVGAAFDAMRRLGQLGLIEVISNLTQPVLGICLGMQMLLEHSEEGGTDCLGIVPGTAKNMPVARQTPVPNMGWCRISKTRDHDLLRGIDDGSYFYFLHSYALPVGEHTLASSKHAENFTAILAKQNFYATQFHPERSAAAGARLLQNFVELQA